MSILLRPLRALSCLMGYHWPSVESADATGCVLRCDWCGHRWRPG
jgi:hypothetical protein